MTETWLNKRDTESESLLAEGKLWSISVSWEKTDVVVKMPQVSPIYSQRKFKMNLWINNWIYWKQDSGFLSRVFVNIHQNLSSFCAYQHEEDSKCNMGANCLVSKWLRDLTTGCIFTLKTNLDPIIMEIFLLISYQVRLSIESSSAMQKKKLIDFFHCSMKQK